METAKNTYSGTKRVVEPRYNEPLHDKSPGITNDIFKTSCSKMDYYKTKPLNFPPAVSFLVFGSTVINGIRFVKLHYRDNLSEVDLELNARG